MTGLIARLVLALSVLMTTAGGAVAMAGDVLPTTPVYSAKLVLEQLQLNWIDDPGQLAARHLNLAQVRHQELLQLAQAGEIPEDAIQQRMQAHYNLAFQFAAQLEDPQLLALLAQAGEQLEAQIRETTRTQTRLAGSLEEPLGNMLQILNQFRLQVQQGLENPSNFRWQYQHQNQSVDEPPCTDCDPVGDQHRYGPQPEQPGPGEPGGNPACTNCDPVGDQHQYGPQPEQPGPDEPGGNPACTNCDPVGDQNQHGQGGNMGGSGHP